MSDVASPGLALGIDVGTSGVRCAITAPGLNVVATAERALPASTPLEGRPSQLPDNWWEATVSCLGSCLEDLERSGASAADVEGIAVDGTSGTALICDDELRPLTPGLMYDSSGFVDQASAIDAAAPEGHMCRGHSSGLARLLYLQSLADSPKARHATHQADWITAKLCGQAGQADANNVLKSGYDAQAQEWPEWIAASGLDASLLPQVHEPGTQAGLIDPGLAESLGLSRSCRVHLGTTDSVAAFLATGVSAVGDAVTSLGTTLAVKILAAEPVTDLASGVYSHRIGGAWLPGGASNSGGGAVAAHFDPARIEELTEKLRPQEPTGFDFYPLPGVGERFPVNDPQMPPRTEPRPDDEATFLQALLEGVANVERIAYERLRELGAPWPSVVHTVGGGAVNKAWTDIRSRTLGTTVLASEDASAAAGVSLLARGPLNLLSDAVHC